MGHPLNRDQAREIRAKLTAGATADDLLAASCEPLVANPVPGVDESLAAVIDHTLLKPECTLAQFTQLCQEALDYRFGAVCVPTAWLPAARALLRGDNGQPRASLVVVVGFPHGNCATRLKADSAAHARQAGATDIDMVLNIGALKSGNYAAAMADVAEVAKAAAPVSLKVIIETALLTDDEIVTACLISEAAGAGWVKTSTGFSGGGATLPHVKLMRETVGDRLKVKASGGVRTADDARAMLAAGANRIGTSSGIAIVTGGSSSGGY